MSHHTPHHALQHAPQNVTLRVLNDLVYNLNLLSIYIQSNQTHVNEHLHNQLVSYNNSIAQHLQHPQHPQRSSHSSRSPRAPSSRSRTFRSPGVEVIATITTNSTNDLPDSLMSLVRDLIGTDPFSDITHIDVPVGLDKETIRKMKTRRFHSATRDATRDTTRDITRDATRDTTRCTSCCICLKEYKTNTKLRVLPCKHEFHKKCIDKWFSAHVKCPVCRLDVRDILSTNTVRDSLSIRESSSTNTQPR